MGIKPKNDTNKSKAPQATTPEVAELPVEEAVEENGSISEAPATVGEDVTTDFPETVVEEVEKVADVKVDLAPKMVKVRTSIDHRCNIGGVNYHFEKGIAQNVPTNVKEILLMNNLLMAL